MRSWLDFAVLLGMLLQAALLGGCSVDAEALREPDTARAPIKGPGAFDAGVPDMLVSLDAVPGTDSLAAEAPRAASDSLPPDAVSAVDVHPPFADTGTAPDLRAADVLPAPDLAPGCPYVAWVRPNPSAERWMLTIPATNTGGCFTVCGTLASVFLTPPSSRVTINGVATSPTATEMTGYLPAVTAVDGLWVFRVGDPVTISVAGYPNNTTGACP